MEYQPNKVNFTLIGTVAIYPN